MLNNLSILWNFIVVINVYILYNKLFKNMIKEKDILIRVDLELKELIKKASSDVGLSASSFIRNLIIKELKVLGLK